MKKIYEMPELRVTVVKTTHMLCTSTTEVLNISTGVGINYGGGSNQAARVKEILDGWEDWEE